MRPALRLLIAHNLPFAAWTAYAAYRAIVSGGTGEGGWPCPVHALLQWCPSCGLTGGYARLLSGQWESDPWLLSILALFLLNAGWSLFLARRASTTPVFPAPIRECAPPAADPSAAR